jgi:hypothetical protein
MRYFFYLFVILMVMGYLAHRDHLDIGWKWEPAPTPRSLAPAEPEQVMLSPSAVAPWVVRGYTFKALAHYSITARILHVAPYAHDNWSDVSPVDFALGWGRMSDPTIYEQFDISQFERHYIWRYSHSPPPIPEEEIISHSANTHLLPADDNVRDRLFTFQRHDVVRLVGYLVQIDLPEGGTIMSSLTRTDVGDGACEVMWVTQADKVGR